MKSDKIIGAVLIAVGLGLAAFGVACLLAFPELTAWLILFSGVCCVIVGVLMIVIPSDAAGEPRQASAPDKTPFYQRPIVYGPAAALCAALIFIGAVHGREAAPDERTAAVERNIPSRSVPGAAGLAVEELSNVPEPAEAEPETVTAVIYGTTDTVTLPLGTTVWLPKSGEKFHASNDCGRMDSSAATAVTVDDAVARGYEACKNCYGK